MKSKAYSYIRMSTEIQLRGDSLRRQSEASRTYAAENDLELVEDFKLEDIGISAFHGRNVEDGSLGRFLSLVQNGQIPCGSFLLVESLDRISRQSSVAATTLFLQILKAGVNIVTLVDKHVYRAGSADFIDIIQSVLIMSRAHEESKTKSMRVGAAWENKRQGISDRKLTRMCPSWLELNGDRKSFRLMPDRVEIVRAIFNEASTGKGSYQIARALNKVCVPPFGRGDGWHESFISKLLTSRAVLGEFQPHRLVAGKRHPEGTPIKDYFPRIVSDELFALVGTGRISRKNRGSGRKGRSNINLFSGVATCGYCGAKMRIIDKGAKPKGGIYLGCENARRGARCRASLWLLEHLETAFLRFVSELDLSSLISERSPHHLDRLAQEASLAALNLELARKFKIREQAFEMLSVDGVEGAYVQGKLAELTNDIVALEKERADLRAKIAVEGAQPVDIIETEKLIRSLALGPKDNANDRTKVSDWIRRNVETMRVFPDGLDGPPGTLQEMRDALSDDVTAVLEKAVSFAAKRHALVDGGHRRFEIAFGPLTSRIVEVDRADPLKFVVSMRINEFEAVLETAENEVTRRKPRSTVEHQIVLDGTVGT
ncbi:recombinase family protein [Neorhizobium galegae]|uniref:recombinase family protein n=1 Tax=Neorhizobium galegae TaxID=399 RepID=UPI001279C937|nr:recombinase family protein [Neorhizobium galegae]KAA9385699.1 recombinase family protein [Neorhizobium galegae]MCM2499658.1 recombinase family protein [Neorhizobium galegae]